MQHHQIPAKPNRRTVQVYDLAEMTGQTGWGSIRIIDLPARANLTLQEDHDSFIECIEGSVELNGHRMPSRTAGQLPAGTLTIRNRSWWKAARLIIVQRYAPSSEPIEPETWSILDRKPIERPGRIFLRSLWQYTKLAAGVGYEWVEIKGLVARHHHQAQHEGEQGSLAIVLVIGGKGECGVADDDGPGRVFRIGTGSVLCIPEWFWHGFKVGWWRRLLIISIQVPEIGTKYRFARDEGVPEFNYTV